MPEVGGGVSLDAKVSRAEPPLPKQPPATTVQVRQLQLSGFQQQWQQLQLRLQLWRHQQQLLQQLRQGWQRQTRTVWPGKSGQHLLHELGSAGKKGGGGGGYKVQLWPCIKKMSRGRGLGRSCMLVD